MKKLVVYLIYILTVLLFFSNTNFMYLEKLKRSHYWYFLLLLPFLSIYFITTEHLLDNKSNLTDTKKMLIGIFFALFFYCVTIAIALFFK